MKELPEISPLDIATNIKRVRRIKSLTQENIASKLDISQNAYSKIELGHSKLTVERLFQIADILNVKVIQLINFKPKDFTDIELTTS